jgi:hypothetical protein
VCSKRKLKANRGDEKLPKNEDSPYSTLLDLVPFSSILENYIFSNLYATLHDWQKSGKSFCSCWRKRATKEFSHLALSIIIIKTTRARYPAEHPLLNWARLRKRARVYNSRPSDEVED